MTENGGEMSALVSAMEKKTCTLMIEMLVSENTTHALSYLNPSGSGGSQARGGRHFWEEGEILTKTQMRNATVSGSG